MPTLEAFDRKIAAIGSIVGIVRTMKALAAVNIPAAERAAASAAAFHETILDGISVALRALPEADTPLSTGGAGSDIMIAFGTDHGLCGGFNETLATVLLAEGSDIRVFAVGGRLASALERHGFVPRQVIRAPAASEGLRSLSNDVILALDGLSEPVSPVVTLVYHVRAPGGGLAIERRRLLPLDAAFTRSLVERPWPTGGLPMLLSSPQAVFVTLLRQHLAMALFRAGAASLAAEHAARLALMTQAEKELEERLEETRASHRRMRQASITEELLDIVSGFEAIGAR